MATTTWTRGTTGYTAEANGWGLHVYCDDHPVLGNRWFWSAMRFEDPSDDTNDRILSKGGDEDTKAAAMRAAVYAAEESES